MEAVACAVTFGTVVAQLAVVSLRMKRLWGELSDVPERIQELLEDVEHIRLLFAEVESSIQDPSYPNLPLSFWAGPLMQLSLNKAKRALAELEKVAEDLGSQMKNKQGLKRKLGSIRALMDKGKIQALENRLSRSVDLFWKSHELASRRLLTETLQRRIKHTLETEAVYRIVSGNNLRLEERRVTSLDEESAEQATPTPDSSVVEAPQTGPLPGRPHHQTSIARCCKVRSHGILRFRLPTWWSSTVWELCSRPLPGLNYGLRVYNVVPDSSEIIKSVQANDAATVLDLFQQRKASPFDRNELGRTLLDNYYSNGAWAKWCMNKHTVACKNSQPRSAFNIVMCRGTTSPEPGSATTAVVELFWPYREGPDYPDPLDFPHNADPPSFHRAPARYRAVFLRISAYSFGPLRPNWVAKDEIVISTHLQQFADAGCSIMHSVAINMACLVSKESKGIDIHDAQNKWPTMWTSQSCDTLLHAVAAIAGPEELHRLEGVRHWRGTPLTSLIVTLLERIFSTSHLALSDSRSNFSCSVLARVQTTLTSAIYGWARELKAAGVDLLTYGCEEQALLRDGLMGIRGCFDADSISLNESLIAYFDPTVSINRGHCQIIPVEIIDLKYGAEPEEWELVWVFEFEAMAREFWDSIERAPVVMPGSWVE